MKNQIRYFCTVWCIGWVAMLTQGCSALMPHSSSPGAPTATEEVFRPGENFVRTWQDISPEEENNLGRAVAAQILALYPESRSPALEAYLNKVGLVVAAASDRPETFGGYKFVILDTDEINALSSPGGIIFITRGFLKLLPDEDALAAVLAHEVSHVVHKHGLQAIQPNKMGDFQTVAGQAVGSLDCSGVANQSALAFSRAVDDIVNTLLQKGYSREQEHESDQMAAEILKRRGYNVSGLAKALKKLEIAKSKSGGWFSTHPAPQDRLTEVVSLVSDDSATDAASGIRKSRFLKALK